MPFFSVRDKGGTELFLLSLARSQVAAGHQVKIVCPNTKEEVGFDAIDGISITYFPFPYGDANARFLSGIESHRTCDAFRSLVEEIDPEIIHMHGFYPHFLKHFEALGNRSTRKLLLTVHLVNMLCPNQTLVNWRDEPCDGLVDFARCSTCISSDPAGTTRRRIVRRVAHALTIPINAALYRAFSAKAFATHTPSQSRVAAQIRTLNFLRENAWIDLLNPWFHAVFARNGFSPRRLSYFHSPVFDPANFLSRPVIRQANARVKFLFVGRLSPQKGIRLLIQTLKRLGPFKDRFVISLVGRHTDAGLVEEIRQLARQGYRLALLGEMENRDIPSLYRNSDYLLFPSAKNSGDMLPLVIQEALENNLPVVSSDIPSAMTMIHEGVNGYLFSADDPISFEQVLREIIDGKKALQFEYRGTPLDGKGKYAYYDHLYRAEWFANNVASPSIRRTR